jgi:predicted Zn-dependent protease with MMP-like domain
MALVHEHAGDPERADALFAQAANLAPGIYQLPVRIEADDFQAAAEQAVASLPAEIRRYVANCPILIEDLPDRDLVQSENVSPQVLGLFLGTPATEPGASPSFGTGSVLELDRVLLFKRNLEKIVGNREELLEQVQITVKHEIGHFLGLEEDDMERLGLA